MLNLIFSFILMIFSSVASEGKPPESLRNTLKGGLVKPAVSDPLINEVVVYKPISDHHFNLEAPQGCGKGNTIDPTAREISCQFHSSGEHKVRLSVCDNAKKYCKQELVKVFVRQKKSGTPRIKTSPTIETVKMQNKVKKLLMGSFKSMSPDEARQAVSTKKAALALVSTDWCPPCNQAKEFLLPTKGFKEATKDMLLIYVDGDNPSSDAWKPFLKSRFYPTFIVLNKDLESVSLFSDSDLQTNSTKISKALTQLNDSYADLEARVEGRLSGSLLQKIKDFFTSKDSIEEDQKRLLKYLAARGMLKEKVEYMKKFSKEKYKSELLQAEQQRFLFGQQDKGLSKEETESQKAALDRAVLDLEVKGNDLYGYTLNSFCNSTKVEAVLKTKRGVSKKELSKDCLLYIKKYTVFLENSLKEKLATLPPAEQVMAKAESFSSRASLAELQGDKKKMTSLYDSCFKTYNKLYQYSPLKEKSRSVRLQQLYCLNDDANPEGKLKLLTTLVKDYPFEETFQRKLASYYLKKKNYRTAAEYNAKAVKYSYGNMWAYNMNAKVRILRALNKNKEALSTLEKALQEFVLEKKGRSSRSIKMLRGQYEELKAELKKKNT